VPLFGLREWIVEVTSLYSYEVISMYEHKTTTVKVLLGMSLVYCVYATLKTGV